MILICIILLCICFALVVYVYMIKRQVINIRRELEATRKSGYNRQLKIALFDDDMEQMTATINENLDYQKELKLENEQSKQQLKQSVSDIAHDLRTPLTVIKGNLQMLEQEENLSPRGKEFVRVSVEKTDALREMVDDFFELSVLESDASAVSLKRIDATVFLTQFIIDNEAVIRQRELTPKLLIPEKSIFIEADEKLLSRMCNNLLNNILKYAKDEFLLELKCDSIDNGKTVITFANDISHENEIDIDKIFNRTYRGDIARPSGGAGLGLYIVKLLADKQDADVSAYIKDDRLYISVSFAKED